MVATYVFKGEATLFSRPWNHAATAYFSQPKRSALRELCALVQEKRSLVTACAMRLALSSRHGFNNTRARAL